MDYLDEQEEFERLIGRMPEEESDMSVKKMPTSGCIVIYFGATWCGPCKKVAPRVEKLIAENSQIRWLKCDVDRNSYTPGFCNVKAIPAFLAIQDRKIIGQIQLSDGDKLAEWVGQVFLKK